MINLASIENMESSQPVNNEYIDYGEPEMTPMDSMELKDDSPEENTELFSIERRRKILILQFYLNEFPNKLGVYREADFESLSNEELDKIRSEFDFIIGAKNTVNISVKAFQQSIYTLEHVCVKYTPLKVQGLSNINEDPELLEDVKHWALKNMALIKTEPEQRILFKVMSTITALHSYNTMHENTMESDNSIKQSTQDIEEEFSDL